MSYIPLQSTLDLKNCGYSIKSSQKVPVFDLSRSSQKASTAILNTHLLSLDILSSNLPVEKTHKMAQKFEGREFLFTSSMQGYLFDLEKFDWTPCELSGWISSRLVKVY